MRKPSSITFTVGTRCKTSFLTSTTTAVGTQQMSKIQKIGRQTKKLFNHYEHAKIIQPICSINQILSDIHLIFESHDPKGLGHF